MSRLIRCLFCGVLFGVASLSAADIYTSSSSTSSTTSTSRSTTTTVSTSTTRSSSVSTTRTSTSSTTSTSTSSTTSTTACDCGNQCTPEEAAAAEPAFVIAGLGEEVLFMAAADGDGRGNGKTCRDKCLADYSGNDQSTCLDYCNKAICKNGCTSLPNTCSGISNNKANKICVAACEAACGTSAGCNS